MFNAGMEKFVKSCAASTLLYKMAQAKRPATIPIEKKLIAVLKFSIAVRTSSSFLNATIAIKAKIR